MTHDPAVKAAQRAQMIPSLQEVAATGAREMVKPIRELHADLTEVHGIKAVYSSVWRDLLTLEQHGIVERIKPTGHRGWLFRLKGTSRWQTQRASQSRPPPST